MMRLEPYWAVMQTCLKDQLVYRFELLNGIISPFLTVIVLWFVWTAVYASSSTPVIGGYTFTAMITYTALAVVMRTYTWLYTEYAVEHDVKSGSVASILIKPLSYPLYNFARDTGATVWWLATKLPLIVFAFIFMGVIGPASPLFFLSAFLGYVINYFMVFITAMWAFWTAGSIWGLRLSRQVISEVMSGALMPLTLFPAWTQGIFKFLPFQAVFYSPLSIYMGVVTGTAVFAVLAVQLAWIGMLFALTWFIWKISIKRVVVQGG